MLLEPYAASLAVVRGGEAMVQLLRRSEQMAAAIDEGGGDAIARIQEANRTFHRTLLEYCGSTRLRAFLETMIDMPIIVRSFFLYTSAELEQSLNNHEDLTLAAGARDGHWHDR